MPFNVGIATFPAVTWLLSGPAEETAASPELPLEIQADSGKDGEELADIRPPWRPFNYWPLALLLALAAAAAGLWYFLKRRRRTALAEAAPEPDRRPAEVIALEALEQLLSGNLWQKDRPKPFYNRLADILRDYITRRTAVQAHNFNTTELCRELDRKGEEKAAVNSVRKFLSACDLVKFAKYLPEDAEKDAATELMRDIIRKTTPPPPPGPVPQAGQASGEAAK